MIIKNNIILSLLLLISLCCGNNHLQAKHDGFIAGACALGMALIGTAGAVALADWCSSETDELMASRIDNECRAINSHYYDTMIYFLQSCGMSQYVLATYKPFNIISEAVLFEFATYVWKSNLKQSTYRTNLCSAKNQLKSNVHSLSKRVRVLEGKCYTYEEQQKLHMMRKLLHDVEELFAHIALFYDCLEHHKSYFNLYDSVEAIRMRYIQEITIFESGRYSVPEEIKRYIISRDSDRYAFCTFVNSIESAIATLQSDIRSLAYNYDSGRQYAYRVINYLTEIKNIVVVDPRYQQELYAKEQERLQQLQIEFLHKQARLEQERINAIRHHNRIIEQRNRIEQERLRQTLPCQDADLNVSINFTI